MSDASCKHPDSCSRLHALTRGPADALIIGPVSTAAGEHGHPLCLIVVRILRTGPHSFSAKPHCEAYMPAAGAVANTAAGHSSNAPQSFSNRTMKYPTCTRPTMDSIRHVHQAVQSNLVFKKVAALELQGPSTCRARM